MSDKVHKKSGTVCRRLLAFFSRRQILDFRQKAPHCACVDPLLSVPTSSTEAYSLSTPTTSNSQQWSGRWIQQSEDSLEQSTKQHQGLSFNYNFQNCMNKSHKSSIVSYKADLILEVFLLCALTYEFSNFHFEWIPKSKSHTCKASLQHELTCVFSNHYDH